VILWFVLAQATFGRGSNCIRASRETNGSASSASHFEQMVVALGGFFKMRSVETRVAFERRPRNGGVFQVWRGTTRLENPDTQFILFVLGTQAIDVPLCDCVTVFPCDYVIVLLCYCVIVLLCR
jgi:hypothetical protein